MWTLLVMGLEKDTVSFSLPAVMYNFVTFKNVGLICICIYLSIYPYVYVCIYICICVFVYM